jgi:hypothetical protein
MRKKAKHRESVYEQKRAKSREPRPGQIHLTFERFDGGCPWCETPKGQAHFCDIAKKLRDHERMDWNDTFSRDHRVLVSGIIPEARQRLLDFSLDDTDELWRFRFDGKTRLWGRREGSCFLVLWWDPDHMVCPSMKKHT